MKDYTIPMDFVKEIREMKRNTKYFELNLMKLKCWIFNQVKDWEYQFVIHKNVSKDSSLAWPSIAPSQYFSLDFPVDEDIDSEPNYLEQVKRLFPGWDCKPMDNWSKDCDAVVVEIPRIVIEPKEEKMETAKGDYAKVNYVNVEVQAKVDPNVIENGAMLDSRVKSLTAEIVDSVLYSSRIYIDDENGLNEFVRDEFDTFKFTERALINTFCDWQLKYYSDFIKCEDEISWSKNDTTLLMSVMQKIYLREVFLMLVKRQLKIYRNKLVDLGLS